MQALEKAYEARSGKINKIEEIKNSKNPMSVFEQIERYAKEGYASIPDEDKKYFLKCFGIYDKDSQTPQQFMMRVRVTGGHLNATQAKAIGEIARDYGDDYLDITTRAQVELRYLSIEDMPQILQKLKVAGLDSYQTGVDNFRNIVTDPLDKVGFDTILPSYELVQKLQYMFLYNPDWISTLPRKFNTAITGSLSNRCNVFGHDCCFVLAQKEGVYGYNMFLGGKVGVIAKDADIFLASEDEVIMAYASIIEIFKKFGFRDNRNKNRLHYLIEAVGMEEISSAIRQKAGVDFASAGETITSLNPNDMQHGKVQLRDGSFSLQVVVPSGVFTGTALVEVAELSEKYANGEIRFTVEQNIYILGVKDVNAALKEALFEKYKNVNTPYFNNLIACAGTKHCSFGVIENKEDAIKMAEYLSQNVALESGKIRMYWSACVKGCGTHEIADIGFEGCKVKINGVIEDGVHISLGGKVIGEGKNGYSVIKSAPLKFAHLYVESLVSGYKKLRIKNESFENYHERVLAQYSSAYIGFVMQLEAYMKAKNIAIDFNFNTLSKTGKNEEFELFEFGRKLYYQLSKETPFSAYRGFTNENKKEKARDIRTLVPEMDENLATLISQTVESEEKRARSFSELLPLIGL
jgi:ferredoxin-nitrite reductase